MHRDTLDFFRQRIERRVLMKYLRRQFPRDLVADHARAAGVQERLARSREPFEDGRDHERVFGVGAIDDGIGLARRVPDDAVAAQVAAHRCHAVRAQLGRGVLGAGEPGRPAWPALMSESATVPPM
jgi:hypothetical protein